MRTESFFVLLRSVVEASVELSGSERGSGIESLCGSAIQSRLMQDFRFQSYNQGSEVAAFHIDRHGEVVQDLAGIAQISL